MINRLAELKQVKHAGLGMDTPALAQILILFYLPCQEDESDKSDEDSDEDEAMEEDDDKEDQEVDQNFRLELMKVLQKQNALVGVQFSTAWLDVGFLYVHMFVC